MIGYLSISLSLSESLSDYLAISLDCKEPENPRLAFSHYQRGGLQGKGPAPKNGSACLQGFAKE